MLAGPIAIGTMGRAAVLRDPQGAPFGLVHLSAGDPHDPAAPVENTFFWNEYLTHDMDATLAFYNGLVPYEVTASKSEAGAAYVVLKQNRPRAGVFRVPDSQSKVPPNWLPYVWWGPGGPGRARRGTRRTRAAVAQTRASQGLLAIVADPTGAVVALQKFPF